MADGEGLKRCNNKGGDEQRNVMNCPCECKQDVSSQSSTQIRRREKMEQINDGWRPL